MEGLDINVTKPIVVLDSGIGGINIAKVLSKKLDQENIIALSDIAYMPYGDLNQRELISRVNYLLKIIDGLDPKAIVIGCNTIDSVCGDKIIASFPTIPVYRIIKESARIASSMTHNKNIAVFATPLTIENQDYVKYLSLYTQDTNIYGIMCDELAKLIENQDFSNPNLDVEIKMAQELDCDTIILGCTHYSLVMNKFKKFYPQATIIDSALCLVDLVAKKIPILNLDKNYKTYKGSLTILTTSASVPTLNTIDKILTGVEYEIMEV